MFYLRAWLICLCCLGLLASCGGEDVVATTAVPTPSPREQALAAAKADWEAQQLNSYSIDIQYNEPQKNAQNLVVEVRQGEASIVSHSCMPQRTCVMLQLAPADFTIDHLIARTETLLAAGDITHLVYHESYAYPRIIESQQGTWLISNFQPLE